jgi:hypothetical protein
MDYCRLKSSTTSEPTDEAKTKRTAGQVGVPASRLTLALPLSIAASVE